MARKRKASESTPASNDASPLPSTWPTTSTKKHRPKIDWGAIDENGGFGGFTVKTVTGKKVAKPTGRPSLKKQRSNDDSPTARKESYKDAPMGADVWQPNPYPETKLSDVYVKVEPQAEWESTQRYRKFTINSEEFEVGQIVFVKKADDPNDPNDTPDAIPQWFAKVLEVRAGDASHVFLRVYWAYRPEDFPAGRQPHHGAGELIVSNHMDIIEAVTVESVANVIHWTDNPEESAWPAKDQLYWRQSYDITKPKGKQFSQLPKYCVDKAPCNPDEPVVQCPSCTDWLHARCLEDSAVKHAAKRATKSSTRTLPTVSAKLSTSDPNKTRLTVTLQRPDGSRTYDVPVKCLICGAMIDDADTTPNDSERATSTSADEQEESDGIAVAIHPGPSASKRLPESTDDDSAPERDSTAEQRRTTSPERSVTSAVHPATPLPPEHGGDASVLQSGFKSVRRMLWGKE